MCEPCEKALREAREWAVEVERRKARVVSAQQREGEARARYADHAASHPYRFEHGGP